MSENVSLAEIMSHMLEAGHQPLHARCKKTAPMPMGDGIGAEGYLSECYATAPYFEAAHLVLIRHGDRLIKPTFSN
jgi:hypothetical protein